VLRRVVRSGAVLCLWVLLVEAAAAERAFDLTLDAPAAGDPRTLRVTQGDTVELRLTATRAGVAHLHALRLETNVRPGEPAALRFVARTAGRFRLEWHTDDGRAPAGHHAAPAAVLEVHPR